jgi:hypothetical protein
MTIKFAMAIDRFIKAALLIAMARYTRTCIARDVPYRSYWRNNLAQDEPSA